MRTINGGRYDCSDCCLDEEDMGYNKKKYQFVETARFALHNCKHASYHLQCILSDFINRAGLTYCPIHDTPQCRFTADDKGNRGEEYYWAPEDFYNFARAFLRIKALTDAFLRPEYR